MNMNEQLISDGQNLAITYFWTSALQKQPPRGVPSERWSESTQQIYRRTPMPKYDFNKVEVLVGVWSSFLVLDPAVV